jgi:hypothetical protein
MLLRAPAISEKEFLAYVQRSALYCRGIELVLYRSQVLIPASLIFARVRRSRLRRWIEISELDGLSNHRRC